MVDKEDVIEGAKSYWDKFVAAVKSAPMTFVYGLVAGYLLNVFL